MDWFQYTGLLFLSSATAIALFWLLVFGIYVVMYPGRNLFFSEPLEVEDNTERQHRLAQEKAALENDLRRITIDIKDATSATRVRSVLLIERGIAENRTISRMDEDNELPGDLWTVDGRPLIFAMIQFPLVVILTDLLNGWFTSTQDPVMERLLVFVWAMVSTLVVSVLLGYFSAKQVEENTRLSVRRFGRQLLGFLGPGLQFTFPRIEKADAEEEEIPLKTLVWGPMTGEADDGFHIDGVAGQDSNPETGLFNPYLKGRWPLGVTVQVTFHFEKSRKRSWHDARNRYRSTTELGEHIAQVLNGVLMTEVRELAKIFPFGTPTEAMHSMNQMQNEIPEICAPLLRALVELRETIPVIFERVVVSVVKPSEELQRMLQVEDEARTQLYAQQKEGEGVKARMEQLIKSVKDDMKLTDAKEIAEKVIEIAGQEAYRKFADTISKQGSVEAFIRAIVAGKAAEQTQKKP